MDILKKWISSIIVTFVILVSIIVTLTFGSKLPKFEANDESIVSSKDLTKIVNMLSDEKTKKNAESALNELYQDKKKDDNYYITLAKIVMANSNNVDALSPLYNVKNRTEEYYALSIKAAAGEFFTMGNVPDGLLKTAIEATKKYAGNADFALLTGELYYDKDNYYAAIYYLNKALQVEPNNVEALYYYGLSTYLLGDTDSGILYMEKAQNVYKGKDEEFKKSISNYIDLMKEGKR